MKPTPRSTVSRMPSRAAYDQSTVFEILDEAMVAHVAFVHEGTPVVIPMNYGRDGDRLYLHGANASRLMKDLASGVEVSFSVALVDGLVLARSAFHHSMNYRSVVLFGSARAVEKDDEKIHGLRVISEHLVPGRWDSVRPPTPQELAITTVLELTIVEASAKSRSGPPSDDPGDVALPVWAGEIPLRLAAESPVADAFTKGEPPPHISSWNRGRSES